MKRIATLTMNPTIDVHAHVKHLVPDHKLRVPPMHAQPGGGGVNVARVVHELGGDVQAVMPVGGGVGHELQHLLAVEGLEVVPIPIHSTTRRTFAVVEDATEKQYRFIDPGPRLSYKEWRECLDRIMSMEPFPDYIVFSGSMAPGVPPRFMRELAERTSEVGSKLVVDTHGDTLRTAIETGVHMVKPSLRELADLTGHDGLEEEFDYEPYARELIAGPTEAIVISMGERGAYVVGKGTPGVLLPSPDVHVVSTVGAGDAMTAATVLGLSRGLDLVVAVRFGAAAGAATCMREGSALCQRQDAEELFRASSAR